MADEVTAFLLVPVHYSASLIDYSGAPRELMMILLAVSPGSHGSISLLLLQLDVFYQC